MLPPLPCGRGSVTFPSRDRKGAEVADISRRILSPYASDDWPGVSGECRRSGLNRPLKKRYLRSLAFAARFRVYLLFNGLPSRASVSEGSVRQLSQRPSVKSAPPRRCSSVREVNLEGRLGELLPDAGTADEFVAVDAGGEGGMVAIAAYDAALAAKPHDRIGGPGGEGHEKLRVPGRFRGGRRGRSSERRWS